MKFFKRDKEKLKDASLENWRIHDVNGKNFLMHNCTSRLGKKRGGAYNSFKPTFKDKGNRESWRCTACKRFAPKEMIFAAELALCQRWWNQGSGTDSSGPH
jgi:hypothetical protein